MVIPNELTYANYAGPALSFLQHSFSEVTFLTFQEKLFPHLSEDTLLLLAEGKGGGPARFRWRDLPHPGRLADLQRMALPIPKTRVLNANRLSEGKERLIEYLLPAKARTLYRELVAGNTAVALGEIADVGIGYVTGANDYFHLSSAAAASLSIPPSFLRPALRRGRSLDAVCFNEYDLQNAITSGDASYLLYIKPQDALPASVRRYIEQGEKAGIPNAYKCRARKPWYCVPQVYSADAFLSYMSGMTPKLVSNDTLAVAPNSLHVLRMHESSTTSKHELAARWQTSLTRLSCEIEGHSLGGGMLKLEPTEAERVLIPAPRSAVKAALANELDLISRTKGEDAARHHADSILLRRGLGLSSSDCALLRQAATCLLERRYQRGAA